MSKKEQECLQGGDHDWKYYDNEYGSLADGGSYEIYKCTRCPARTYVPLPD